MLEQEQHYWDRGLCRVAGVDEAGRGPLAGPVLAAAVVLEPAFALEQQDRLLRGLTDSKRLTQRERERFDAILRASSCIHFAIGEASVEEIDRLNIRMAAELAMRRALEALPELPDMALVDGLPVKGLPCPSQGLVGGDGTSLSIAGASVLAKVTRDAYMRELDSRYPHYGFGQHKGYGTRRHMQALYDWGPCPEHRVSFRPVREALGNRDTCRPTKTTEDWFPNA